MVSRPKKGTGTTMSEIVKLPVEEQVTEIPEIDYSNMIAEDDTPRGVSTGSPTLR